MDNWTIIKALQWAHANKRISVPTGLRTSQSVLACSSTLTRIDRGPDDVNYEYTGPFSSAWWDDRVIWEPYATIYWVHEAGAPLPATKKPVIEYHPKDPAADPKPSWARVREIMTAWQAVGSPTADL
ncbi:hypothetical protein [Ruegeria sp.]|uniref:hypothetical protein n=1 Tax=Ruegeria sp. TaxID=1879320 RepID=UPI003B591CD0